MKKLLFISPTPTHPTNAGNRAHIKSLVGFFKEQNFDVHFLYLAYENFDEDAMRAFIGENFTIIDRNCIYQSKKTPLYILWKLGMKLNRLKRKVQLSFNKISKQQYQYNNEADNYFSVFAGIEIKKIAKRNKYSIVVCEYVSMSKSLTYFGKDVYKILDTHDVFTDRFTIFLKNGMKPSWVSLYKDQEKKAIGRANLVLAVNENDRKFLSGITNADIALFNFIPQIIELPQKIFEKKLLYLASGNNLNISTIHYFLEEVFPLILKYQPETKLIIGGSICRFLKTEHPNVILHGEVNDTKDFYSLGDVVINPEREGTGYKVKALEALAFGMPLVSTSAGAAGITEPFRNHFLIANEPGEFAITVNKLFQGPQLLKTTSQNAHNWVKDYKNKITKSFVFKYPLKKSIGVY